MTELADLIERLRKRAEIRRQIPHRKSVQEGQADRIADLLDEAADKLEALSRENEQARNSIWNLKELANSLGETLIENEAERLLAALAQSEG